MLRRPAFSPSVAVLAFTAQSALAAPRRYIENTPAISRTSHEARNGTLRESYVGERTHDVLGTYLMVCPHTLEPNPIVLVVLDPQQPMDAGEPIARELARHGYAGLILDPARASTVRIDEAIDAVRANAAASPDEPGCNVDGRVGLYGVQRGGELGQKPEPSDEGSHAPPSYRLLFDLPLVVGATFADAGTTAAIALRTEVLFARVREGIGRETRGVGIGVYAEAAKVQGHGELGAGLTAAVILGRVGLAPSFGVIRLGGTNGVAGSVFLGLRDAEDIVPFDLATGLRVDVRSVDGETTVSASFQFDLVIVGLAIKAINELTEMAASRR